MQDSAYSTIFFSRWLHSFSCNFIQILVFLLNLVFYQFWNLFWSSLIFFQVSLRVCKDCYNSSDITLKLVHVLYKYLNPETSCWNKHAVVHPTFSQNQIFTGENVDDPITHSYQHIHKNTITYHYFWQWKYFGKLDVYHFYAEKR